MSADSPPGLPTVVITGGLGNLGSKLCRHLLRHDLPQFRVVLIEHPDFVIANTPLPHTGAELRVGDVGDADDPALDDALRGADAVVHFSAVNPYPNADWSDSAQSMDHAFHVFHSAVRNKVRRVVFATSNHVMGGYKDDVACGMGSIRPDSEPRVGTVPLDKRNLEVSGDAVAYAAAKLAGERLAMLLGATSAPVTTFVCLRIGWCQPGENLPATLTAAGSPPEFLNDENGGGESPPSQSEGDRSDELWFKRMWLSNRDFLKYFESALSLEVPVEEKAAEGGGKKNPHRHERKGFVLLNAMSHNDRAKWNLEETERLLGVVSHDDSLK